MKGHFEVLSSRILATRTLMQRVDYEVEAQIEEAAKKSIKSESSSISPE